MIGKLTKDEKKVYVRKIHKGKFYTVSIPIEEAKKWSEQHTPLGALIFGEYWSPLEEKTKILLALADHSFFFHSVKNSRTITIEKDGRTYKYFLPTKKQTEVLYRIKDRLKVIADVAMSDSWDKLGENKRLFLSIVNMATGAKVSSDYRFKPEKGFYTENDSLIYFNLFKRYLGWAMPEALI